MLNRVRLKSKVPRGRADDSKVDTLKGCDEREQRDDVEMVEMVEMHLGCVLLLGEKKKSRRFMRASELNVD